MPEGSRPHPYFDSFTALVGARALTTAVMLGVFDALHEQPATAAELAVRLGLDPLGADTLLTTLTTLGYVEADGDLVRNAPVSEEQLVRCSPNSIATFVGEQADLHWQTLALLPDAVRDGRAYAMHEQRHDDSERWEAYIRGLYEISRPDHDANAALVPVQDPRLLVDVAGGHGAFSMAMCRRHPRLRATVIDLPPAAAVGRRIVQHEGYADRVSFREGDVFEVGLGEPADVISAFNLIHHLPQARNRELCRIAHASLRPGGCLVIANGDDVPIRDVRWHPRAGEGVSQVNLTLSSRWRSVMLSLFDAEEEG